MCEVDSGCEFCIVCHSWSPTIYYLQIYDEESMFVGITKANEERYPAIGELSFFLGIPQVYTFKGRLMTGNGQ